MQKVQYRMYEVLVGDEEGTKLTVLVEVNNVFSFGERKAVVDAVWNSFNIQRMVRRMARQELRGYESNLLYLRREFGKCLRYKEVPPERSNRHATGGRR